MMKMIDRMTGYKATDANMRFRDVQFELGVWVELSGDVVECERGFHFCEQPSGVWAYYNAPGARVFKIEAEDVLDKKFEPGADFKRVCRKIRLVEEIRTDGYGNTGNRNTGNRNTGDGNTGNGNTGNGNATNRSSGFFCTEEPTVLCFDVDSGLKFSEFRAKFGEMSDELLSDISEENEIDIEKYSELPGFTAEKVDALIKKLKQVK